MKVRISGHIGDALYSLCVIRNLGGGPHEVLIVDSPNVLGAFVPLAPLIIPVMEAQPYISRAHCSKKECDLDLTDFRKVYDRTYTLVWMQQKDAEKRLGRSIPYNITPWISEIEPHSYSPGRIIVSRSFRYRNLQFPWKEIVKHFGDRLLFVGLGDEHNDFERHFGWIEYMPVRNFMDMAQLMVAAGVFIGNQSGPHALAMGMGVDILQETCPMPPDCIFKRPNAQYCPDGRCDFHGFKRDGIAIALDQIDARQQPPGGWEYKGKRYSDPDDAVIEAARADNKIDKVALRRTIIAENVARLKGFFSSSVAQIDHSIWQQAFRNAGLPVKETILHLST